MIKAHICDCGAHIGAGEFIHLNITQLKVVLSFELHKKWYYHRKLKVILHQCTWNYNYVITYKILVCVCVCV